MYLNEQDIINVLYGATLLAGGGGGSLDDGLQMLKNYKKTHETSENPIKVQLLSVDQMNSNGYAAITAGMGAPSAVRGAAFSKSVLNSFNALENIFKIKAKEESKYKDKELMYSLAAELGGVNTFVPILISLMKGIPLIDGDGAARAVPALNTLLLHINGCEASPIAMANGKNDVVQITLSDTYDTPTAEKIGRQICAAFNGISGLSGWLVHKDDWILEDKVNSTFRLPQGTISLSNKVGKILRNSTGRGQEVFDELNKIEGFQCQMLGQGTVVRNTGKPDKEEGESTQSFDSGSVFVSKTVSEGSPNWIIHYKNENLIIEQTLGYESKYILTAPDIICTFDSRTNKPLTNNDIKQGMDITIGAIKVNDSWEFNPDMYESWRELIIEASKYYGSRLPYKDHLTKLQTPFQSSLLQKINQAKYSKGES